MLTPPPGAGRANRSDESRVVEADLSAVGRLLGREPSGSFSVVVRSSDGTPAVIENYPILEDGRPMPTRFWLVDPSAREAVSRVESTGGVREAEAAVDGGELSRAHELYAAERDRLIPEDHRGPRPTGGVGGTRRGVKCLHAHLAWWMAGGQDPVGRWVAQRIALDSSNYSGARFDEGPVAAIDCGTNSTRLLVVGSGGAVLDRLMRITRLGQDVDATRRLAPKAIARTVDVLEEYRLVMDSRRVVAGRLVATSATRDADNADEFFAAAEAVTGIRPELLSGEEEGRLSFAGATADLAPEWRARAEAEGPLLVVDIGGGSTELVVGDAAERSAEREVASVSLDIGCVRVSERFLHGDPPSSTELASASEFVESEILAGRAGLPRLDPGGFLIGLAGTVSTLAALEAGLAHYDRSVVHHAVLTRDQVSRWLGTLAGEDRAARLARPGMAQGREDVIVGGVMVLDVVMEAFGFTECLVSEDDILDGLAASVRSGIRASAPPRSKESN